METFEIIAFLWTLGGVALMAVTAFGDTLHGTKARNAGELETRRMTDLRW